MFVFILLWNQLKELSLIAKQRMVMHQQTA